MAISRSSPLVPSSSSERTCVRVCTRSSSPLSLLVNSARANYSRRNYDADTHACAKCDPVRGGKRRVAARARHGVQPSTGGSKAGSTPTYNCGPAGSPPGLGCALRPNQRGGEWRLRRWRDAWTRGSAGIVHGGSSRAQAAGNGRRARGQARRGSCRPAARAHPHHRA